MLRTFSLINHGASGGPYSLHPLVHLWGRDRIPVTEQQAYRTSARALLSRSVLPEAISTEDFVFRQALIPHIKAHDHQNATETGEATALSVEDQMQFGQVFYESGEWEEAEVIYHQVAYASQEEYGSAHPFTSRGVEALAMTYWNQGRFKAAENLQVKLLQVKVKKFGINHPDTLATMTNLALTYHHQGRWSEAEKLFLHAVEAYKKMVGDENPITLLVMGNLAHTYFSQERWKEAEELQIRVMEARKKVHGPDHPYTLASMNSVAMTFFRQDKWKKAEELHVVVMEKRKALWGPDHPETVVSMGPLAMTLWARGKRKEAEQLQIQMIEKMKSSGSHHPDVLIAHGNLAAMLKGRGEDDKALELMQFATDNLDPSQPQAVKWSRVLRQWRARMSSPPSSVKILFHLYLMLLWYRGQHFLLFSMFCSSFLDSSLAWMKGVFLTFISFRLIFCGLKLLLS